MAVVTLLHRFSDDKESIAKRADNESLQPLYTNITDICRDTDILSRI